MRSDDGPVHFLAGEFDLRDDAYARLTAFGAFFTFAARRHAAPFDRLETIALNADGPAPSAIRGWAASLRLVGPWVEPTAIETSLVWRADLDRRQARTWCVDTARIVLGRPLVPAEYIARVAPPDPLRERRDDWLRRAEAEWDQRVALLKACGFKPAIKKTTPEHFDWLADYLFGGQSIAAIAKNPGRKGDRRKTVSLAIHRLADLIQLELPEQNT